MLHKTVKSIFDNAVAQLEAVKRHQSTVIDKQSKLIEKAEQKKGVAQKEFNSANKVINNFSTLFDQD